MAKKVRIRGNEYPCVLTIGVLKKFKDETGKELDDVKDVFSICTLVFMAATASCKKEKMAFPWDSADELMDDIELSEIETITGDLFGISAKQTEEKKTFTQASTGSSESPSE